MPPSSELLALQNTIYTSKNPTRRTLHCLRRDWVLEKLATYLGTRKRALEVGPGSGVYIPHLAQRFDSVMVTDIEPEFLENAEALKAQHPNLECRCDDITNTQLPEGSFNLILCSEVIEHIEDSRSALVGLRRLLAPGGLLLLTTPQKYSPLEICSKVAFLPVVIDLVRYIYQEPILETGHINLLTAHALLHQLHAADLQVKSSDKLGLYLPLIAEFGGKPGARLLQRMEQGMHHRYLDWLLWTQCYALRHTSL